MTVAEYERKLFRECIKHASSRRVKLLLLVRLRDAQARIRAERLAR